MYDFSHLQKTATTVATAKPVIRIYSLHLIIDMAAKQQEKFWWADDDDDEVNVEDDKAAYAAAVAVADAADAAAAAAAAVVDASAVASFAPVSCRKYNYSHYRPAVRIKPNCKFYPFGRCTKGAACPFNHDDTLVKQPCKKDGHCPHYQKHGYCSFGGNCFYEKHGTDVKTQAGNDKYQSAMNALNALTQKSNLKTIQTIHVVDGNAPRVLC